jgi:hypothetical protein
MMDKHFQIAKKDSKINWLCDVDQKGEDWSMWYFVHDLQHSFVQEVVNGLICWFVELQGVH